MNKKLYKQDIDYREQDASEIRKFLKNTAPLETFNFQSQGPGEHWITIKCPEYTSICPFSDFPDFGKIKISYIANKKCLELKSFKLYVNAFREIKIFHETATEVIFQDFLEAVNPKKAKIIIDMNVRGNIKTICKKFYKITSEDDEQ